MCKIKAASYPVIVPSDEERISVYKLFLLKKNLIKDLSEIPIEAFHINDRIFYATLRMIETNLFYRIDEYTHFLNEIVENFSAGIEVNSIIERAWSPILKPIHLILRELLRSPKTASKLKSSFVTTLTQLISSPIEAESIMVSSLIK